MRMLILRLRLRGGEGHTINREITTHPLTIIIYPSQPLHSKLRVLPKAVLQYPLDLNRVPGDAATDVAPEDWWCRAEGEAVVGEE